MFVALFSSVEKRTKCKLGESAAAVRMVVGVRRKLQEECRLYFVIKLRTFPVSP
jgi:hypothetical protein